MTNFERLQIPSSDFRNITEIEKVTRITNSLENIGISSVNLLYCGVEGSPFEEGTPADRDMTFAATHKKMLQIATEMDQSFSSSYFDFGYPLGYALSYPIRRPAIATYDRAQMTPQHPRDDRDPDWLEEWVHKDGLSISKALVAIVFLEQ